jgi:hypothetical protein
MDKMDSKIDEACKQHVERNPKRSLEDLKEDLKEIIWIKFRQKLGDKHIRDRLDTFFFCFTIINHLKNISLKIYFQIYIYFFID